MKKKAYKTLFILFLLPIITLANHDKFKGKYTKEKELKKEFVVNDNALLKISNSYGNINVTSWNQNRIVLEISIKVNGDDETTVIQRLENINVLFSNSPTEVKAKTAFGDEDQSWWTKMKCSWSGNKVNMEINYTVKIPVTNSVDFKNNYGNIKLDRISGNAKINCDYGQIIIGELLSPENNLSFDYSHNCSIVYMNGGKINADYSDFVLEKAENIVLNAGYTESKIKLVEDLKFDCDYGSLSIKESNTIVGNGDYLGTKIGTVKTKLVLDADYGAISVEKLGKAIKEVNIKTNYTGVDITYDPECNFDCEIRTSYGGITTDITTRKQLKESTSKNYEGYYGSEISNNIVDISTSYGSVKLTRN